MNCDHFNTKKTFEFDKKGKIVGKGYGYISNIVMESNELSKEAKCLYAYLISKAGVNNNCCPSNSTIMKHLGIKSKISLNKYKDELVFNGLLDIKARTTKSGRNTSNYYYPTKMVQAK